jgi:hypothetical protein
MEKNLIKLFIKSNTFTADVIITFPTGTAGNFASKHEKDNHDIRAFIKINCKNKYNI